MVPNKAMQNRGLCDSFAELIRAGDHCDLAHAALVIARIHYPDLEPSSSLRALDGHAAAVAPRLEAHPRGEGRVRALADYLFDECGFHGNADDYYDPRNSFLNDVLERRTGIPISLALVLMETGARVGLAIEGVGFPGHFLVRTAGSNGPLYLDPFDGGRVVGQDELLERLRAFHAGSELRDADLRHTLARSLSPTGPTGMLARMLGNILHIYLDHRDHRHALQAIDLLVVLEPTNPEHRRVRGVLYEQLECFAAARQDLEHYLREAPEGARASEVRAHLTRLGHSSPTVH